MAEDKEFLGLGVVFRGIDKGFRKSVEGAKEKSTQAAQAIKGLEKSTEDLGAKWKRTTSGYEDNVFAFNRSAKSLEKSVDGSEKKSTQAAQAIKGLEKSTEDLGTKWQGSASEYEDNVIAFDRAAKSLEKSVDGSEKKSTQAAQAIKGLEKSTEDLGTKWRRATGEYEDNVFAFNRSAKSLEKSVDGSEKKSTQAAQSLKELEKSTEDVGTKWRRATGEYEDNVIAFGRAASSSEKSSGELASSLGNVGKQAESASSSISEKLSGAFGKLKNRVGKAVDSIRGLNEENVRLAYQWRQTSNDFEDGSGSFERAIHKLSKAKKNIQSGKMTQEEKVWQRALEDTSESSLGLVQATGDLGNEINKTAKKKDNFIGNLGELQGALHSNERQAKKTMGMFGGLGGFFSRYGTRRGNLFYLVANLQDLFHSMKIAVKGTDLDPMSMQFDNLFQRMKLVFDPQMVNEFSKATFKGMRLGVLADDAYAMAQGLQQFGIAGHEAIQMLPTMQEMVGVLGQDADYVATMFGQGIRQLKMTPPAMTGLVKQVNKLGRAFGFTNPLEGMPEVVKGVTESISLLSGNLLKDSDRMVVSIYKVAGGFKAMGRSQKESIQIATEFHKKNTSLIKSIEKYRVGLGDAEEAFKLFNEISMATGKNAGSVADTFTKFKTAEEAQGYLQGVADELEKAGRTDQLKRFLFIVEDTYGTAIAEAIGPYRKEIKGATSDAEKQADALGSSEKAWNQTIAIMKNNLMWSQKSAEATEKMVKIFADLGAKKSILERNALLVEANSEMADKMANSDNKLVKAMLNLRQGLIALSSWLGFPNAAEGLATLSALGEVMGVMTSSLIILSPLLRGLGSIIAGITNALVVSPLKGFGKMLLDLVPSFGKTGTAARGAAEAVEGIGGAAKTAPKFLSKFVSVLGKVAKVGGPIAAIAGFISDIPAALASFMEGDFGGGIMNLLLGEVKPGEGFTNILGQAFKWGGIGTLIGGPIGGAIGAAIGGIVAFIREGLTKGFGNLGDELLNAIGYGLGKVGKFAVYVGEQAWEGLKWLGDRIVDFFLGIPKRIGQTFGFIAGIIKDTFNFTPIGKFVNLIWDAVTGIGDAIAKVGTRIWEGFSDWFPNLSALITKIFSAIKTWLSEKIDDLVSWAKSVPILKDIIAGWSEGYEAEKEVKEKIVGTAKDIGTATLNSIKTIGKAAEKSYQGLESDNERKAREYEEQKERDKKFKKEKESLFDDLAKSAEESANKAVGATSKLKVPVLDLSDANLDLANATDKAVSNTEKQAKAMQDSVKKVEESPKVLPQGWQEKKLKSGRTIYEAGESKLISDEMRSIAQDLSKVSGKSSEAMVDALRGFEKPEETQSYLKGIAQELQAAGKTEDLTKFVQKVGDYFGEGAAKSVAVFEKIAKEKPQPVQVAKESLPKSPEQPTVQPVAMQEGAVGRAPSGAAATLVTKQEAGQDEVVAAIESASGKLLAKLSEVAARGGQVNVTLQGDARKFLTVMRAEAQTAFAGKMMAPG